MKRMKRMKRIKSISLCALFAICIYYMCTQFLLISKSVISACNLCINNVIPALFPFFILSQIFLQSFDVNCIPKPLIKLYSFIFKMPECTLPVFVAGFVSGYPMGASAAYSLYTQGNLTKKQTESLICFTNNSGPLFVISAVGIGIFGNLKYGVVLYIIHITSVIITGALMSIYSKITYNVCTTQKKSQKSLTYIIENSFERCIKLCGFIIFFSIINAIICNTLYCFPLLSSVICCICEITNGISTAASNLPIHIAMPLASFAISWSGICVTMQAIAVTECNLSMIKYVIAKFVSGCIGAILCSAYINISNEHNNIYKFSSIYSQTIAINAIIAISVGIILLYICGRIFAHKKMRSTKTVLRNKA